MNIQTIIPETIKIFSTEKIQQKVADLEKINFPEYKKLHPKFLTPLPIKIDVDKFETEIVRYNDYFEKWAFTYQNLPRYSIPLVNLNGRYDNVDDPCNGSLTEWNRRNPNSILLETDFRTPTEVLQLESLLPLQVFHKFFTRSNILKWNYGAEFVPHIDNIIPCYWIRLWGTTDPNGIELSYYDLNSNSWTASTDIEAGRIYIIDTSFIHKAKCIVNKDTYQFFLSLDPSVRDLLCKLI